MEHLWSCDTNKIHILFHYDEILNIGDKKDEKRWISFCTECILQLSVDHFILFHWVKKIVIRRKFCKFIDFMRERGKIVYGNLKQYTKLIKWKTTRLQDIYMGQQSWHKSNFLFEFSCMHKLNFQHITYKKL